MITTPRPGPARLRTPRAAAVAGILFSLFLIATIVLINFSFVEDPTRDGESATSRLNVLGFAVNLVPLAGIAFLWFIGVVRDRLGLQEDRFFATVFLGSGLLFLAMLFASAAVVGGTITTYTARQPRLPVVDSGAYLLGRSISQQILNVYAIRMAAVFMISTCTLSLRTGILPRWLTFLGYGIALVLLFSPWNLRWIALSFPGWVLLISILILYENFRSTSQGVASGDVE